MKKFTSRKFIISMISAIAGVVTMFVGHDAIVQAIAGALMVVVPTIVYCIMEGRIDAASVKQVTSATADAVEALGKPDVADKIDMAGELVGDVMESIQDDTVDA